MIYTIEVEINQFQDKAIRAKAAQQSVSPEDILTGIVNNKVIEQANAMVADALNTKLSKMDAGLALARLEAMDD